MVSVVDRVCLSRTYVFVVREGTLGEGETTALEAIG